jgi:hypothetical protein
MFNRQHKEGSRQSQDKRQRQNSPSRQRQDNNRQPQRYR